MDILSSWLQQFHFVPIFSQFNRHWVPCWRSCLRRSSCTSVPHGIYKARNMRGTTFCKTSKRSCNSHSNSSTWLWIGALIGEVKSCNHWIGWAYLRLKPCFWPPNWSGFPAQTSGRKDPYDLNALHAIDDKLAQLVPESEWEALPVEGSERDRSLCFSSQETL